MCIASITPETQPLIMLNLALVLLLACLLFAVLADPYVRRRDRRLLLLVITLSFSLLLQNEADFLFSRLGVSRFLLISLSVYGYAVRPIILALFIRIAAPERRSWPLWTLIGINAAIHLSAFFSGICFAIGPGGSFTRGPLGYSCAAVSFLLLFWLLALSIQGCRSRRTLDTLIPVFSVVLIVSASLLDMSLNFNPCISFLNVALTLGCLMHYLWLHLQFALEHEQALQAEQRIQIMMSQIQPHFLFNTLSTIQALCEIDPAKASETTGKLAVYLRQNLDSLNRTELIPLQKELEHVRVYAEIEMLRFPNVRVEYDIADESFSVPALSIQPLVENAIRHGVRICDAGIVTVVTRREADAHTVLIRDNGKGFDPHESGKAKGSHIGIQNVRERVEKMCGGSLTVQSSPGEGTRVLLRFPLHTAEEGRA